MEVISSRNMARLAKIARRCHRTIDELVTEMVDGLEKSLASAIGKTPSTYRPEKPIPMRIRKMDSGEISRLLEDPVQSCLRPVRCNGCGHSGEFERRVFQITHVPIAIQADAGVLEIISDRLRRRGVKRIYLRQHKKRFYADSAVCPPCRSTTVVFEFSSSEETVAEVARLLGADPGTVKGILEGMKERIERMWQR